MAKKPIHHETSPMSQEEQALWERYQKYFRQEDRTRILSRYAFLVRLAIGKMKVSLIPTIEIDDLESAGVIGLIKAVDKFDVSKNVKFETYAYRWIQGSVLDYLRQVDDLSRTSRQKVNKFKRLYAQLSDKLRRSPTEEEMMKELGITMDELNRIYFEMSHSMHIPIDTYISPNEEDDYGVGTVGTLHDAHHPGPLALLMESEKIEFIKNSIRNLSEKERLVVSLYYYDDLTFKEIGEIIGTSESRVCQLHGKAMLDIQHHLTLHLKAA